MQYRRFGKTDWQVSEIGLGGSWFYGRPEFGLKPFSYGARIVERALELGINYFDTAPLYGQGRSEEVLGAALKGVTEPYYLATKVGYYPEPFDYTRDTVWRGFEASLKRLQRDKVDLLQIHEAEQAGWDGIFGTGRTLETLLGNPRTRADPVHRLDRFGSEVDARCSESVRCLCFGDHLLEV